MHCRTSAVGGPTVICQEVKVDRMLSEALETEPLDGDNQRCEFRTILGGFGNRRGTPATKSG